MFLRILKIPFLSLLIVLPVAGDESAASERPNVLLLLVDDLKPALGCYGDETALTPHLDALASRGMRFDAAYCNQAVCAPSRYTLMLGSHSTSTGLYGLRSNLRETIPKAVTIPQHFAKHGYRTESLGKIFHIGHGNEGDPYSFSVPHFKEKVIEYLDPKSKPGGELTREEAMFTNAKVGNYNSLPRGAAYESPDVEDDAYADGRVANETIERLKSAKQRRDEDGTPFFIAAGFARPHLPFSAPKKYWDLYDPAELPMPKNEELPSGSPETAHKRGGEIQNYFPTPDKGDSSKISPEIERELIHGYYASTSYVDAQIGRVIDGLDHLGLAENTIIVLWGDHGFHLGDLGIWTKHTNYEQANRIPILITAPGVTKPGSATRQLTESVDIYPTLAELARLPAPVGPQPLDGVSLVPVLKDADARVRDHAFHAYPKGKMGRAIRTDRYRLVEWKGLGAEPATAEYELYDYSQSDEEILNIVSENPEVMAELKEILARYPDPVGARARPSSAKSEKKNGVTGGSEDYAPIIANEPLKIHAEVRPKKEKAHGVVLAQGGRENGYALHFVEGRPVFDVRIEGKVTRIMGPEPLRGIVRLDAVLNRKEMTFSINGDEPIVKASPGLIPRQPQDGLSVGLDRRSAAGDYEAPNPLTVMISNTRVEAGGNPPAVAKAMKVNEIRKGFASHDKALFVKEGWIRDPYLITGPDGWMYLTGTSPLANEPREETDPYNTGLGDESIVGWQANVWRSKDFATWESLDAPYSLKDGIWFETEPQAFSETPEKHWFLWAPELHWIDEMEKWALVHTSPSPVAGANLSLSAGAEVKGPWTNPFGASIQKRHDPSLFHNDDGTWWMVWGATKIAPLKPDFSGFSGEEITINPGGDTRKMGHEGCLIMKIEGKYVLFGTGWSTGQMRRGSYNLYYAVADDITGPYSERKFAGRFLGHGTPFQDPEGRWWCTAFYNANVPPLNRNGIEARDLRDTAQTINQRGTTIVPMEVKLLDDGELFIRAKDPAYASVGADEAQDFDR
ncbi:MAG: sulfatase-like hydrolase/transferase [Verrucomicrobiales bacterium]|nr:sulfatase-like hydrolase/transferase [Verrucomicrobiales bacterium]